MGQSITTAVAVTSVTMKSFVAALACVAMANAGVVAPGYAGHLGYAGAYGGLPLAGHGYATGAVGYAAHGALGYAAHGGVYAGSYDPSVAYANLYPAAEPYVDVQIAAEPYVDTDIAAEPYVHKEIAAEPYVDAQIAAEPYVHEEIAAAPAAYASGWAPAALGYTGHY